MIRFEIVVLLLVALLAVPAYLAQGKANFTFGASEFFNAQTQIGKDRALIEKDFGKSNEMVILIPKEMRGKELSFSKKLESMKYVTSVISYSNSIGNEIPPELLTAAQYDAFFSKHYSRVVVISDLSTESPEVFHLIDGIRSTAKSYFGANYHLIGESVSTYDMKVLKDLGYQPKKTIRLILGLDEEDNWNGMKYYLEKEKAPDFGIVPDAEFPLVQCEKGLFEFDLVHSTFNTPTGSSDDLRLVSLIGGDAPNMVAGFVEARISGKASKLEEMKRQLEERAASLDYNVKAAIVSNGGMKELTLGVTGVPAHAAQRSIPSPVFAETGITVIFGFNSLTRSTTASKSKSKMGFVSILLIKSTSAMENINGYFRGLSSPSGTLRIMAFLEAPVSNSAGHTKLPTFSSATKSSDFHCNPASPCFVISASKWHIPPVCTCTTDVPVLSMLLASTSESMSASRMPIRNSSFNNSIVFNKIVVFPEPGDDIRFRRNVFSCFSCKRNASA